jgi:hypothetical protein
MRFTTTLVALAFAGASTVGAQVCVGSPSFSTGPIRLEGGLQFGNDAMSYGVGAAVGSVTGPFASASVGIVNIDDVDESATVFGAKAGWDLNLAPRPSGLRLGVCPIVAFDYQNGPEFDVGFGDLDLSATQLSAGLSVGASVVASPTMNVIPFGALRFARTSFKVAIGDQDEDESENHGILDLGVGFAFNNAFTFKPSVQIPLGLEDSDPVFGVTLSYNFKRSR